MRMKFWWLFLFLMNCSTKGVCWGFYGHKLINYHAVFLLPPEMLVFFKPNVEFISEHAVDPDKRRYALADEGARHYIDMDRYITPVPQAWTKAVGKFSEDTLKTHGIVPWWIQVMLMRLTNAFKAKNATAILKLSAEAGHYIADAHVPLHTSSNHNGQLTGQHGIHGFWESRIPEIFAESEWDLYAGKATYLKNPLDFTWKKIMESSRASDSVLSFEKILDKKTSPTTKYSYEPRNGQVIRQYSYEYSRAYNEMLGGMIERRFRESIHSVACLWYTAWVNAGKPDLKKMINKKISEQEKHEFEELQIKWKTGIIQGRACN